jgi:hypothetical protein
MAFKIAGNPVVNILYAFGMIVEVILVFRKIGGSVLSNFGENSMLVYVIHPYTNNLAYILIASRCQNGWWLQFIISMFCLFVILWIRNVGQKTRYSRLIDWF